eukprot:6176277-Pleurochrysis_carterae.AAC.1
MLAFWLEEAFVPSCVNYIHCRACRDDLGRMLSSVFFCGTLSTPLSAGHCLSLVEQVRREFLTTLPRVEPVSSCEIPACTYPGT